MAHQQSKPSKPKKHARNRLTFTSDIPNRGGAIEMIQTEEADPPLRQFPAILRRQIEEYLKEKMDNKPASFISGSAAFRLFQMSTGEPTHFVVSGTKEPLDAGLYRYGIRKAGRNIIVVQPKDGRTTFNNGEPAIIAYYSKGKKDETASRFAVWSPEGVYRNDIFVDRIRGQQQITIPQPSHHAWHLPELPVKVEDVSETQHAQSVSHADESNSASRSFSPQHNFNHYAQAKIDNNDDLSSRTTTSSPFHLKSGSNTPFPSIESDQVLKRALPTYLDDEERQKPRKKHNHETCDNGESMIHPDLAVSQASVHPPSSNISKNIPVIFKENVHTEEARLSKTLGQCNSVQKLFAYARLAKISDHKHAMLEAHIDEANTILVVRDDDSTLKELLDVIKEKQNREDQQISIVVTEAEY